MDILFIADPLDRFKIYKDTTYAMMAEAARRGHTLYACEPQHLAWAGGDVEASVRRIAIVGDEVEQRPRAVVRGRAAGTPRSLHAFRRRADAQGPAVRHGIRDVHVACSKWPNARGARVFNKPQAIRDHSEKLAIGELPQFVAPTLVTRDAARLRAFHAEHGDVILKPLDGMGGMGVFRVKPDGMNLGSIIEMLSDDGARSVMAQKFIPANHRRRQAHSADRRPAGAVFAGANSAGQRSARQSGGGRSGPCAAADRARSRDRRNAGAGAGLRAACCWSGWMRSATI